MKLTYKPLFKMMIDRELKNSDVIEMSGISKSTFYKLKNDENVNTEILLKVCEALECDISEIVECEENKKH
ncbi:MAG: helix-turn-helix domain-containing protein [Christensenellales bacterium]